MARYIEVKEECSEELSRKMEEARYETTVAECAYPILEDEEKTL